VKPDTKGACLCARMSLIPFTLTHTTLGIRNEGDLLNVEFDRASSGGGGDVGVRPCRPDDEVHMSRALAIAEKGGRFTAPPNPWVGCVCVSAEGDVIGEGFHARAGQPHAEINALSNARARGNAHLIEGD
jgi:hypothetical protein